MAELVDIVGVFTQPDRAQGRSKRPVPSPVKQEAGERGWPVYQPATRGALTEMLSAIPQPDIGVVVAYGMILDPGALAVPQLGMLNVHFSRLPRWRGAAPVERAILAGDTRTAVSLMLMDEGLDTGPILAVAETEVGPYETGGALTERLAELGAELLTTTLPRWMAGEVVPVEQAAEGVTYAKKLTTSEARIDPSQPAVHLLAKVRAFNPRPGAFAWWRDERLKIWEAREVQGRVLGAEPGSLHLRDDALVMQTGAGLIELVTVQPAGGVAMPAERWVRGRHGDLGSIE